MPIPAETPVLTDGVVTLRAPRPDDLPGAIARAEQEPGGSFGTEDITRWIGFGIAEAWTARSQLVFVIEYQGRYAGSVGLRPDHRGSASIHFGLSRWARGAGVAARVVRLVLDFGFGTCGFPVVHWWASVGNWPSRRVAWATGFQFGPTMPSAAGSALDEWTGWITPADERRPRHSWFENPVLETPRLRLRTWRDDELARITAARTNPATGHFLPFIPQPFTTGHARFWLHDMAEQAAAGRRYNWCVADRDTDLGLGNLTLFGLDQKAGSIGELGFWVHPEAQGRGVIVEAVRRVAAWFFSSAADGGRDGHKLLIRTAATNSAARKVAERSDFQHVGTDRRRSRSATAARTTRCSTTCWQRTHPAEDRIAERDWAVAEGGGTLDARGDGRISLGDNDVTPPVTAPLC
ncbi:GCN5-related N-acetyltransferase [Kribbella flavida DSM 17836]|uniref:GCN5-related N-acetyltransferase n=1 Tax=Kribbella flavida (strain DSM 17836 / JCM 10339 / NBRC 14399) TaxID=479435 RepID=D2PM54_KRIFD|nr:GNAT family N-acetyltransferase [Kribbella flavida]ADB34422.1 GCN5-related N-acetyltransferase [Kribbella flavida DSM 17836]